MNDNIALTGTIVDNPEPDWSVTMFWEDITAIFIKIIDFFRSLIGYFK